MKNFLIVGLGNPGSQYQNTRHNIGFRVAESLLQSHRPGGDFKMDKKNQARIASFGTDSKRILVAQPQTFMNKSGQAVQSIIDYYNVPLSNLLVVHDDSDLTFGQLKFSESSGAAGHRGVLSIISQLNNQDFSRLRFGIRPKGNLLNKIVRPKAGKLVLKKFSRKEEGELNELIQTAVKQIEDFINSQ